MKKILLFILLLSTLQTYAAMEKVLLNGRLYLPKGFDDNDLVEVIVVGVLPDTCHKNPVFEIERNDPNYTISLYAYYQEGSEGCRKTNLPYLETISFGMMKSGQYGMILNTPTNQMTEILKVSASISGQKDDFNYGNVTGIIESEKGREIEITGVNPLSCMKFNSLGSKIQKDVIVLQPKFTHEGNCDTKPTPFRIKYIVPYLQNQSPGIMLHVRIMDGRSYNYLYQNKLSK
jgi:hypothetical protein